MANHGYVTTRRKLTTDRLEELVEGIGRARFDGSLRISRDGGNVVVEDGLSLRTVSGGKIEARNHLDGEYGDWIEAVVMNDLALALDGIISADGVNKTCKGVPGIYPTLRSYIKAMRFFASLLGGKAAMELSKNRELLEFCDEREFDSVENKAMHLYLGK
jgi:hypothetical protein